MINEIYSSDHIPIQIQFIKRKTYSYERVTSRWNLKNPNWELFTDLLEEDITHFPHIHPYNIDIESLVKCFTEKIITTAIRTIGKTNKIYKPRVPWWNNEIKKAIEVKNKALNT